MFFLFSQSKKDPIGSKKQNGGFSFPICVKTRVNSIAKKDHSDMAIVF